MSIGQLLNTGASASSIVIVAIQLSEFPQASIAVNVISIPIPPLQSKVGRSLGKSLTMSTALQSCSSVAVAAFNQLRISTLFASLPQINDRFCGQTGVGTLISSII